MINVLRTDGKEKEVLDQLPGAIHLFIGAHENAPSNHELGDLLYNEECSTRFSLLAKEYISSKIFTEALRLSIVNLLNHLIESKTVAVSFVISKYQFNGTKEENAFLSSFKEICLTYFKDSFKDDITIIIPDYKD